MRRAFATVLACALGAVIAGAVVACDRVDCDLDNLGRVVFQNRGNATMKLYVDGELLATVPASDESEQWLSAGNRSWEFKWEDDSSACGAETLAVEKCQSYEAWCGATR